jgi:hypothetical protein
VAIIPKGDTIMLMPKNLILVLVLAIILITAYLTLLINSDLPKSLSKNEIDTAINQANHLYRQEKAKGRDFSSGPCLSDALLPNWVVDIAHSPRQSIDDLDQNQCPSFKQGRSLHFVELDPNGNLIRAK